MRHMRTPACTSRAEALAGLRAFLRARGSGASARPLLAFRLRRGPIAARSLAAALAAALAILLAFPAPHAGAWESPPLLNFTGCGGLTHSSLSMGTDVTTYEHETHWSFSYSTTKGGPWTPVPGGAGTITQAEAEELGNSHAKSVTAELTALSPELTYYVLAKATSALGSAEGEASCETIPLAPAPEMDRSYPTADSAFLTGRVDPRGTETHWRYEYATSVSGPWTPGPEGTVSQAEAEALPLTAGGHPSAAAELTALQPATRYYLRLHAESEPEWPAGSGEKSHKEATSEVRTFATFGPPLVHTFATPALRGEAIRAFGSVSPQTAPVGEVQTIAVGGGATEGTFKLCLEGSCTGAGGSGDLTKGSTTAVFSLPVVEGTGDIVSNGDPAHKVGQHAEITGVTATAGRFLRYHPISGPGIPPETQIEEVTEGPQGTTLILNKAATLANGVPLRSNGPLPSFVEGEAISGPGVPPHARIVDIRYPLDFTGTLILSAPATETRQADPLSAAIPYLTHSVPAGGSSCGCEVNATATTIYHALAVIGYSVEVAGDLGGPYTVRFAADAGRDLPQMTADASALSPSGTIALATLQNGRSYDTQARFQYVSQSHFEAEGFANPTQTAPLDLGPGVLENDGSFEATIPAAELPGLQAGGAYHFRLVATTNTPGNPTIPGEDHTLTVPVPGENATQAPHPCPNEALRTGPSAHLGACRAYEQVTPQRKGGASQAFFYSNQLSDVGALVGEDGNHLMYVNPLVQWGQSQSPYFFSRTQAAGWQMAAGQAQPEAGIDSYHAQLFSPDLTAFAFASDWQTSEGAESPNLAYKAGLPGGPYPTAASVPRAQTRLPNREPLGWVAASDDFSKLILATTDRALIPGHPTATASGADLYEYSAGALRQANVTGAGATIGSCGATIVQGTAETQGLTGGNDNAMPSSRHAVSADGRRVFFYAVPPAEACSEPTHLYMRTDGGEAAAQTVDLGPYTFRAANPAGTQLLLEATAPGTQEVFLYATATATATATAKRLLTVHERLGGEGHLDLWVSQDFSTIYLQTQQQLTPDAPPPTWGVHAYTSGDLYRYDVAAESLHFLFQPPGSVHNFTITPDGRYAYWEGQFLSFYDRHRDPEAMPAQTFLYDAAHNLFECVSCASPYNPEPLGVEVAPDHWGQPPGWVDEGNRNGSPQVWLPIASDGSRAFFDTRSTLLPSDVDGQQPENEKNESGSTAFWSHASDVYEWRRNGLEGCAHLQGCLSLVSSGHGGFLTLLLGADPSGENVFFTTQEQLAPTDTDTAIDVYDARSGGGFPVSTQPVHCEGDACFHPVPAPNDPTPSSEQFHGAGNVHETPVHHKHHKKHHRKHHRKSHHKRAGHNQGSHK
jgi:hypothetical protein